MGQKPYGYPPSSVPKSQITQAGKTPAFPLSKERPHLQGGEEMKRACFLEAIDAGLRVSFGLVP